MTGREADARGETYSIADRQTQHDYVGSRTAERWLPFLLPHLRPGMSLLDCGCGVGSLTLDLAERVAPGAVVGIDRDESQLAVAREQAARRGLTNARFEVADIYALPFPTGSFDAAVAHAVLSHLSAPLTVLTEMRRVLRSGGVIGVADDDWSTVVLAPPDPLVRKAADTWIRVLQHNGASPFYSRNLRGLLRDAGFARTEGYAVAAEYYGTPAETRRFAAIMEGAWRHPSVVNVVVGQGWADAAEIEEIIGAMRAWAERPDAFLGWMYCAAVGWVGEEATPV